MCVHKLKVSPNISLCTMDIILL